ncbi:MAG: 5-(carboxyamino)imidazole ribonucleotide synthase [Gammaproteobacteria bacterium]
MLAQAGAGLGFEFMFFCPDPQACAAPYGQHLCASFDDVEAQQRLVEWADVVTYEFENVPVELVESLERQTRVHPSSLALRVGRDRLLEKGRFRELEIPTAEFAPVDGLDDLKAAVEEIGFPAILKTRTQGYDGKGQVVLRRPEALPDAWRQVSEVPCIVEAMVPFERELSIIAARARGGDRVFYPLSENHHREGILRLSLSLRDDPLQSRAEQLIGRLLESLDYVGVLALELFQVGGELYANEMAPRVHNTGHWTIEGARTSQFENHLRAVAGLPLGSTETLATAAMVNLIGRLPGEEEIRAVTGAIPHFYGKAERPGRKVGHVTLIEGEPDAENFAEGVARLLELAGESGLARWVRDRAEV